MSGKKCCIFVPTVMSLLATCLSFNLNARESVYFADCHQLHLLASLQSTGLIALAVFHIIHVLTQKTTISLLDADSCPRPPAFRV